jgi:flavin-dependent dehydrogenase
MTASTTPSHHDVIVLGGGLAGLTLALQLRKRFAELDVLVLERHAHPVPEACHKVGESSVEIGAHYFEHVLGLKTHLMDKQLKKFGFRFFFSDGQRDLAAVTELGASRPLPVPSWQIDRGIFENFLGEEVQRQGVRFVDQAIVRSLELSEDDTPHRVSWQRAGSDVQSASARWAIDASGRAGLIKRKLGLALDNAHGAHAVWFRIGERLHIDDWCDDADWRARCVTPTRWLSTNHMVGTGYWLWLIPLSSGSHSVGIVADPRIHPLEEMNTFERAMQWIEKHQPRVFDELDTRRDTLQDFAFFRRFSYDCKQVFSANRWALAGEAGRFLDPFYSPGSDFIAMGNSFITELIARDRAGKALAAHTQIYEQIFRSFYDSTLTLYVDQYPLFGDAEVMPVKVIWDYSYYWSVLAQMFIHSRIADIASLSRLREALADCQRLNVAVQNFLRAWSAVSDKRNAAEMLDQASMPWFAELNRSLHDTLDGPAFVERLQRSHQLLRALAQQIVDKAVSDHPTLDARALRAAIGDAPLHPHEAMLFERAYDKATLETAAVC